MQKENVNSVCQRYIPPFLLAVTTILLGGCGTERLRDNTVSVSASTTDIYYQMVLQNLAREYAQPGVLPWGIELSSGQVAVNDSEQLTGGYSETYPAVTPSAGTQLQRTLQQSWTTAPVTNEISLLKVSGYYQSALSRRAIDPGTPSNPQTEEDKTVTGSPDGKNGTTKTVTTTVLPSNTPHLGTIYASCFHFCSGVAPANTLSASYGNKTVFVYEPICDQDGVWHHREEFDNFTRFTMLILGTLDQVTPKAAAPPIPPQRLL